MSIYGPNFTSQSTKKKDTFETKTCSSIIGYTPGIALTNLLDVSELPVVIFWNHREGQPAVYYCPSHNEEKYF